MPVNVVVGSNWRKVTLGSLVFLTETDTGVQWIVEDIDGWEGGAGSTLTSVQRQLSPGAWRSANPQTRTKTRTLKGSVFARTQADAIAAVDRLNAAVSLSETTLTVEFAGLIRSAQASRLDEPIIQPVSGMCGYRFSVPLFFADPRKFGTVATASTGLPASTGGLTLPFTLPTAINATTTSGQVSLVNLGNTNGPLRWRFTGPVVAPILTHVGPDGAVTTFAMSLTLSAGEWVDVNSEAQTVLAQGVASRASSITTRGWPAFRPGSNQFYFSNGGAYNSGALLSVTGTPAWE